MRLTYETWVAFIERHHRAIVIGSLAMGLLCALSLFRLRLDIDVLNMLPRGMPAFDEFHAFVADFGELNQLVVLVDGAELPVLQSFADDMAARVAKLDTVAGVQSRIDVDQLLDGLLGRRLYAYIPVEDYDEVARRLTPEAIGGQMRANRAILSAPFDLATAKAMAQDPLGLRRLAAAALADSYSGAGPSMGSGYFASADGSALLFFVRPKKSAFDTAFTEQLMAEVQAAAAESRRAVGAGEKLRVAYTGSYAYALEDAATLRGDVSRYTLIALLGVLAVFYATYRSLRLLPFTTYPVVLTTFVTFALSLLLFRELNAVSLCFAAILYGLAIDSAIYYFTRLLEERARDGDLRAAAVRTLRGLARADLASSATTATAFLIIGTSALAVVSQIGILTAVGLLVSNALFFTLYPALTFAFSNSFPAGSVGLETKWLEGLGRASSTHARGVTVIAVALAAVALFLAFGLRLDVALRHLRPSASPAANVQDEIEARFGATQSDAAVVVRAADLEEALVRSERIATQLRAYRADGSVVSVKSVEGALPSAAAQRERLERFNALPRREAIESLRQAMAEQKFSAAKFEPFLASFATARGDGDVVRFGDPDLAPLASLIGHHVQPHGDGYIVATYFEAAPGVGVGALESRLRADLPGVSFGVASRPWLEEELGHVLRRELLRFCVFGVAGYLLLLLVTFRHLGTAIAVLAPTILVVIVVFAGMAVAGVALDPVNLIVTPLIFGVGIDYGLYVALRARECGGDVPLALRLCGRALIATALTTIAGFGFLALSRYPVLANMGLLAGIGLFVSVALAVLLVPALLALLGGSRSR